jgi:flagellar basal body-associated protein FliL
LEQAEQVQTKKRRGCRTALIIVAVVLVVVVVASYFACPHLAKYALNKTVGALEEGMIEKLPEGYDAEEVRQVFREVKTAFREGQISGSDVGPKIQGVGEFIKNALEDDELTTEEVDEILKRLRALAGTSE